MCWHRWTMWELYEELIGIQVRRGGTETIDYMQKRERRNCLKCGKNQDRSIT